MFGRTIEKHQLKTCLNKEKLGKYRKEWLSDFPYMDQKDLRKHQIPYHLWVQEELENEGYFEAAKFMAELIEDNQQMLEQKTDLQVIKRLVDHPGYIEIVKDTLMAAEKARLDGDQIEESQCFSNGGDRLASAGALGRGWTWLPQRILQLAIGTAEDISLDGGHRLAESLYHYADFLFTNFSSHADVVIEKLLTRVKKISDSEKEWRIRDDTSDGSITLYQATNLLMARLLLRCQDPQSRMRKCEMASIAAQKAERNDIYADALMEMGKCFLNQNRNTNALNLFTKALDFNQSISNNEGTCNALINLAVTLQKCGNEIDAQTRLEQLTEIAMSMKAPMWTAKALRFKAESLIKEDPGRAASNLQLAMAYFHNHQDEMTIVSRFDGRSTISFLHNRGSKQPSAHSKSSFDKLTQHSSWSNGFMTSKSQLLSFKELEDKYLNNRETVGFLMSQRVVEIESSDSKSKMPVNKLSSEELQHSKTENRKHRRSVQWDKPGKSKGNKMDPLALYLFLDDEEDEESKARVVDDDTSGAFKCSDVKELDYLRCLYGVAKGRECMQQYFELLIEAHKDKKACQDIMDWKLTRKTFWK